ncbi:right-handed parallel beta-helix repeat-containing protein [Streptomyces sp. NPDC047022]|uniref:right-handed parallel beta-helix repeat-containing protein n=1 Tax=Streptomyces sp. NPDC047022 TaxID=3155737 RepID=UPI0033FF7FEE
MLLPFRVGGPDGPDERRRTAMARRSLQVGVSVAAGVLLAGLAVLPAHANTPVACSDTALVQAINDSNGGLNDHILDLTSYCVYTLTDADGQLPTITAPLVIHGHNATIRRDPNATTNFRIIEVGATSLTMDALTVMNGNVIGASSGGGVLLNTNGGSLTTTNVNFQGNSAPAGGAIEAEGSTSLSLTGGTVSDNRATVTQGGGILVSGGVPVALDSVTVTRNRANVAGGGMYLATSLSATVTNSTISHNTAKLAGGGMVFISSGTLSVTSTTIADNRVSNSVEGGGALLFAPDPGGSGTITGSTISGNSVTGFTTDDSFSNLGGGIMMETGPLTLDSTTVKGNQLVGAFGHGGGIATHGNGDVPTVLNLQNGTTLTGNLASGRYSQGGGLYADTFNSGVSVSVDSSHIDANRVTGTGSAAAGIYNNGGTFTALTNSSVNNNTAPIAPAPGGIYTTVAISNTSGSAFTGNTPTNCLLSPAPVTGCVG